MGAQVPHFLYRLHTTPCGGRRGGRLAAPSGRAKAALTWAHCNTGSRPRRATPRRPGGRLGVGLDARVGACGRAACGGSPLTAAVSLPAFACSGLPPVAVAPCGKDRRACCPAILQRSMGRHGQKRELSVSVPAARRRLLLRPGFSPCPLPSPAPAGGRGRRRHRVTPPGHRRS